MPGYKILIQIADQSAILYRDGEVVRIFPISSSVYGTGFEVGSNKTPLGKFKIHKKIGHEHPEGRVFRERTPTDAICADSPRSPLWQSTEDLILSRILWLEGCQTENANTIDRYIYLHGTNQEYLLGQPASHGCIRFANKDVIELFEMVQEGTEVEILG